MMDISGLECIKDAEENWSIPGLRRGLTGLEGVFLDEIERLRAGWADADSQVLKLLDVIRDDEAERDALKAENNLLQAAQGMLKAERNALKAALLMIRHDYSAPGSELEADIDAAIDAARGV